MRISSAVVCEACGRATIYIRRVCPHCLQPLVPVRVLTFAPHDPKPVFEPVAKVKARGNGRARRRHSGGRR